MNDQQVGRVRGSVTRHCEDGLMRGHGVLRFRLISPPCELTEIDHKETRFTLVAVSRTDRPLRRPMARDA